LFPPICILDAFRTRVTASEASRPRQSAGGAIGGGAATTTAGASPPPKMSCIQRSKRGSSTGDIRFVRPDLTRGDHHAERAGHPIAPDNERQADRKRDGMLAAYERPCRLRGLLDSAREIVKIGPHSRKAPGSASPAKRRLWRLRLSSWADLRDANISLSAAPGRYRFSERNFSLTVLTSRGNVFIKFHQR